MKTFRKTLPLILILLLFSCNTAKKEKYDLLILNASIVDVANDEVLSGKLIGISADTIRVVEDMAEENNFEADEVLDARNKFIMPGLWDMHVHFRGGDTLVQENKDLLPLFLAYGITTVRDGGGDITPGVLEWREQIANGDLAGPSIFTPGPKLDGEEPAWPGSIKVSTEEDIAMALDSLESLDADFVKMYDGSLTKEMFYGIIKKSEERGLKTTGHMPLSADFMEAVEYGLDGSEHMYYPLKACSPIADSLTKLNKGYGMMEEIIDSYDPELAEDVFDEMRASDVYVTPTLHIGQTLANILEVDHTADTLLPFIGSGIQKTYQGRIEGAKRAQASGSKMREKMEEISAAMIKPMYEAGVPLLAGSDSGAFNSFVYPGESLHGEFMALSNAGLSPQQVLETSIINGPDFFGLGEYYGGVAQGKVADLLILEKNPLENIENTGKINTVIKSGKMYGRQEIQSMLQNLRE